MEIKEEGQTLLIKKNQGQLVDFIAKLNAQYDTLRKHNLILDLIIEPELDLQSLNEFLKLHKLQAHNKKSFVLVMTSINHNDFDEELIIVPSIQEAHDIIEMEEIERDLGF